jgi:beta-glucosidase
VTYGEGVFVGYRHFDSNDVDPAFCFGHGLSYTTFEYGEPTAEVDSHRCTVTLALTNTGDRRGAEVVQLYVRDVDASVTRPEKELKAFAKVELDAGETVTVTLELQERSFAFWDASTHHWLIEPGEFELLIGASSRDIRRRARVELA